MAGTWALITNPPANIDTMLLMTDGTVLAHELDTANWHRLTPDSAGKYETGSWSAVPSMPNNPAISAANGGPQYEPRFFGSAVLQDGTLFIAGGEYNHLVQCDMAAATLYDPVANTWTNLSTPAGWTNMGDIPTCVMPNGQVLLGNIENTETTFYNPTTKTYTAGPNKNDSCSEESFTLLPDGTVLAVQCSALPGSEKYVPSSNSWVKCPNTPSTLPQACAGIVPEIGPTVLLTTGHALVIGATGNTAIYSPPPSPPSPGTWTAGPSLIDAGKTQFPIDAPAALMPNGNVLIAASPAPPCSFPGPTNFFEYNPATNTVAVVPNPSNNGGPCFTGRMLVVPSGKVLFSSHSNRIAIYTPSGTFSPAWQPVITSFPANVHPGGTYTLSGQQLNGLSQCSCYGDDATMATNYPIVRITNNGTGAVTYCRTAHHSTMAVATGTATVTTSVTIPSGVPAGSYTLVVVANGIPSAGLAITVSVKNLKIEIKEVKLEIKELKLEIKEIKEKEHVDKVQVIDKVQIVDKTQIVENKSIVDVNKPIVENKLKDAENNENQQQQAGDPALVSAIQDLSNRVDALTAQVQQQQAPITPEERPTVGEAPLAHSSTPLKTE